MADMDQSPPAERGPGTMEFLERDAANVTRWFIARGLPDHPGALDPADFRYEARLS